MSEKQDDVERGDEGFIILRRKSGEPINYQAQASFRLLKNEKDMDAYQ